MESVAEAESKIVGVSTTLERLAQLNRIIHPLYMEFELDRKILNENQLTQKKETESAKTTQMKTAFRSYLYSGQVEDDELNENVALDSIIKLKDKMEKQKSAQKSPASILAGALSSLSKKVADEEEVPTVQQTQASAAANSTVGNPSQQPPSLFASLVAPKSKILESTIAEDRYRPPATDRQDNNTDLVEFYRNFQMGRQFV